MGSSLCKDQVQHTQLRLLNLMTLLESSHKWNHTIFVFLCLAYFTQRFHKVYRIIACIRSSILWWLSNITLHIYITFCLSFYLFRDTWVVSTFLIIWIMLLNSEVHISVLIWVCFQFFWIFTWEWKLKEGHKVILCLCFWETTKLFHSSWITTFPPAICKGSNFSTSSTKLIFL